MNLKHRYFQVRKRVMQVAGSGMKHCIIMGKGITLKRNSVAVSVPNPLRNNELLSKLNFGKPRKNIRLKF